MTSMFVVQCYSSKAGKWVHLDGAYRTFGLAADEADRLERTRHVRIVKREIMSEIVWDSHANAPVMEQP